LPDDPNGRVISDRGIAEPPQFSEERASSVTRLIGYN
jgi:hypothetical protein